MVWGYERGSDITKVDITEVKVYKTTTTNLCIFYFLFSIEFVSYHSRGDVSFLVGDFSA